LDVLEHSDLVEIRDPVADQEAPELSVPQVSEALMDQRDPWGLLDPPVVGEPLELREQRVMQELKEPQDQPASTASLDCTGGMDQQELPERMDQLESKDQLAQLGHQEHQGPEDCQAQPDQEGCKVSLDRRVREEHQESTERKEGRDLKDHVDSQDLPEGVENLRKTAKPEAMVLMDYED